MAGCAEKLKEEILEKRWVRIPINNSHEAGGSQVTEHTSSPRANAL